MRKIIAVIACIVLFAGCATFKTQTTSFKTPSAYPNYASVDGVELAAILVDTKEASKHHFNVDLNKIGVLPVRLIVKNDGDNEVEIDASQVFGILPDGSMFNTYKLHQSIDKIRSSEIGKGMATGAMTGALVAGAVGAGIGAAVGGGDSDTTAAGAAIGGSSGAVAGAAESADSIASYIHKEMWHLDWGDQAIYPGYMINGFVFLPKADYQKLQIGVFNISESKMKKVVLELK